MGNYEIKEQMQKMGKLIGVGENSNLYPIIAKSEHAFPEGTSVYEAGGKFHYVCMERGIENKHIIESSITEILYYVFNDITFILARQCEVENRNDSEDFRRMLFKKQLELLGIININYQEKRRIQLEEILKKAPYQD